MEYERLLEDVMSIAKERHSKLYDLPTTADLDDIWFGLDQLPGLLATLPLEGLGDARAMGIIKNYILPALSPGQCGPRYFGFVTGGTLPAAQLGDFLTTIFDQNLGVNLTLDGIAPAIEFRALYMILELLRLPEDVFQARTLTTGATASNVLGMACGRDHAVKHALANPDHSVSEDGFGGATVTIYADRPHASLLKAASIVGIGKSNVVSIGTGLEVLEAELSKCCTPGSGKGAIVSLSFGEVNTGDFTSRVAEIRTLCDKYSAWLHIDAAFGAFVRLIPSLSEFCSGLELADSITGDGHKWLNVPYDSGFFFSRSIKHQTSIFGPSIRSPPPAYLKPLVPAGITIPEELREEINRPSPFTLGIENSRRFRALPLYCALLAHGRRGYTELVSRNIAFARSVAGWMTDRDGRSLYEVLNLRSVPKLGSFDSADVTTEGKDETDPEFTVPLNIVLFRASESCPIPSFRPSNPQGSTLLAQAINKTRKMYVSPAEGAVRIAVSNWSTGLGKDQNGHTDLEIVVDTLKQVMTLDESEAAVGEGL